jgi:hypothetical protein
VCKSEAVSKEGNLLSALDLVNYLPERDRILPCVCCMRRVVKDQTKTCFLGIMEELVAVEYMESGRLRRAEKLGYRLYSD